MRAIYASTAFDMRCMRISLRCVRSVAISALRATELGISGRLVVMMASPSTLFVFSVVLLLVVCFAAGK